MTITMLFLVKLLGGWQGREELQLYNLGLNSYFPFHINNPVLLRTTPYSSVQHNFPWALPLWWEALEKGEVSRSQWNYLYLS